MSDFPWPDDFPDTINPGLMDRERTVEVIGHIARARDCAAKDGLLALESMTEDGSLPEFFSEGLKLVADGTDPEEVVEWLLEHITAEDDAAEKTAKAVYAVGVRGIQNGDDPAVISAAVGALLKA